MHYYKMFLLVSLLNLGALHSQSIAPALISNGGSFTISSSDRFHWSVGEIAVSTFKNQIGLTEGFYQGELYTSSSFDLNKDVQLILYPNPTLHFISIRTDYPEEMDLEIFDITGKSIFAIRNQYSGDVIDLSPLRQGTYIIKIHHRGSILHIGKVIKM
jgi:hypothetical protein